MKKFEEVAKELAKAEASRGELMRQEPIRKFLELDKKIRTLRKEYDEQLKFVQDRCSHPLWLRGIDKEKESDSYYKNHEHITCMCVLCDRKRGRQRGNFIGYVIDPIELFEIGSENFKKQLSFIKAAVAKKSDEAPEESFYKKIWEEFNGK